MIPSGAGNLHSNPNFQIHNIPRWSHLKTWNQSQVILDIPNFNPMKEALWYSHPLSRYSIFSDGPWLYLQKKEWYVHIVRGPWFNHIILRVLSIPYFQGKFIRINFDASGYIAGANIGKKVFTFNCTSRETPMFHVTLNFRFCPDWLLKHGNLNSTFGLIMIVVKNITKRLCFLLLQKPIYWKRHGWFVKQRKNAHFTYSTSFWQAAILN